MEIYLFIFAILLISAIIEPFIPYSVRIKLFHVYILALIFIVGFRTCGEDYHLYKLLIESSSSVTDLIETSRWGYLFGFLAFYLNYIVFVFLVSATTIILFAFVIKKNTKFLLMALLILFSFYFFANLMNQARMFLSIGLVLTAFCYRKNFKIAIPLIVFATLIHDVAVMGVFMLIIPNRFYNSYIYVALWLISVIIPISLSCFFENIGIEYLANNVVTYSNRAERLGQEFRMFSSFTYFLYVILIFVWIFRKKHQDMAKYFNVLFLGLFLYNSLSFVYELSVRGTQIFTTIIILMCPIMADYLVKNRRVLYGFAFYVMVLFFCVFIVNVDSKGIIARHATGETFPTIIPYTNFFIN
ncbi:MAG: EpsG family protein [Bacteroidetes bacterium]|nr:EpsG family protein [Bacteroidota bacterium]